MDFRKIGFALGTAAFVVFVALAGACGPGKEGARCQATKECDTGLRCVDFVCKASLPQPEKTLEEASADAEPIGEIATDASPEEAISNPEEAISNPEEAVSNPEEAISNPEEAVSNPEESVSNPEPQPESNPESSTGPTLYDLLDPTSSQIGQEGATVEISQVVMMSPASRLAATLDLFFVQEPQARQGSYRYGGIAVVFERDKIQIGTLSVGSRIAIKGRFTRYRTVDWAANCTTDADCTNAQKNRCSDVYDKKTSSVVKRCATAQSVPQIELSQTPSVVGAGPVPAPEEVKTSDINKDGTTAQAYLGVYLEVKQVQVTNKNPDDPSDFGEFLVAPTNNLNETLRIDDQINTIAYTGAKFCGCGTGNQPDNTYCLPGDTCQCVGAQVCGGTKRGCCFAQGTQPSQDTRSQGDTFASIRGVLYFSFNNYKLLPRIPTDMQK
ncbi:hypothetical protein L6R29_04605 [Myxococcota bacterium]|nr:hypothetical protein [Myxococcota bacterium]